MTDNVIDFAEQARELREKKHRSHTIERYKMPGVNPAMVSMSVFLAQAYNEIMVKRLATALKAKLEEFAE